jgi:DNA-binding protein H-NS
VQNLKLEGLTTTELLDVRDHTEALLKKRIGKERREIERTLARISEFHGERPRRGRPSSRMKGMKVAPKYRDPETGETWAGRGARPRWLQALMRKGRKPEEFAIEKSARRGKRTAKNGRKRKAS